MPTTSSALTLVVNNDAMVDSATTKTNTNYGASGVLSIKNGRAIQRTFAKFDLTALPQDSVISRATLRIFVNKVTKPGALTVNTVSADWSEGTLTDNNRLDLFPLTNQSAVATLA
ncbi:MAG: DNRLRE domain-containing protein, partial [Methylococcales bacterium]